MKGAVYWISSSGICGSQTMPNFFKEDGTSISWFSLILTPYFIPWSWKGFCRSQFRAATLPIFRARRGNEAESEETKETGAVEPEETQEILCGQRCFPGNRLEDFENQQSKQQTQGGDTSGIINKHGCVFHDFMVFLSKHDRRWCGVFSVFYSNQGKTMLAVFLRWQN